MTILDALSENVRRYPEEIALTEVDYLSSGEKADPTPGKRQMTWRAFYEYAARFASRLTRDGYGRGDKIALLMTNRLEWLPLYFGILMTGAIAVPLNYRFTGEEIDECLCRAECRAFVFGDGFAERIFPLLPRLPQKLYFVGETPPAFAVDLTRELSEGPAEFSPVPLSGGEDAAIYFSSGTTGVPKAVLHTHKSLYQVAVTERAHHGQTHADVFLCIPPLYHTGAKMFWFGSLLTGGRAVLLRGLRPEWILKTVSDEGCSIVWLLVPWAQDILDLLEREPALRQTYTLSRWRLMHIGAQPVPPSLIERWLAAFPGMQYDTVYGLTEAGGPGCLHLGTENTRKAGSVGKAGYGWETMIADENGNPVPRGETGELCVRGPSLMKAYYRDPTATAEALRDGWLMTGDVAREDDEGFVYLVDRKKDVIITGGENLYPVGIENVLRTHPAIRDAAVIGIPDERLGEIPCAVIECREGETLTEAQVNEFCLRLPRYKRPRRIVFDRVPRSPTGKIEKPLLRKKYAK